MADNRAIGVFDSGLGGLTVVKELQKVLPNENIVYFGDTGRVPYGTRSKETIKKYALEDEKFLIKQDVKLIIAACGTVSSVAADTGNMIEVPFFEVVSHASVAAVNATKNKRIAVIGTNATIKSRQHEKIIKEILPSAEVMSVACNMFVPLVEEGWYDANDIIVLETIRRYLQPIIDFSVDTLILGCTHYPILIDAIRKVLGDKVTLINMGSAVSEKVKEYLSLNDMLNTQTVNTVNSFFVTDKADSFRKQASVLLGREINEEKRI